jgi:hypothetical protein
MEAKNLLLAYVVIAVVLLLIVWWVDKKYVGHAFLWLLFVFIIMLFAVAKCNGACLLYLALVAILPVIAWILWGAFRDCNKDKDHHRPH